MDLLSLHNKIKEFAYQWGFADYGAIPVQSFTGDADYLKKYISRSFNAQMEFLNRNLKVRENPSLLMENALSIMVFLAPYRQPARHNGAKPLIASYASGVDYHISVKEKLHEVAGKICTIIPHFRYRAFTDSAPIFEKRAAQLAGLGFIGKNTLLISEKHGIQNVIGVIVSNIPLYYTAKNTESRCEGCDICVKSCPTGALVAPYTLDSRRCISYQTVESPFMADEEQFKTVRCGYIFGCEICMLNCPWFDTGEISKWREFEPLKFNTGKSISDLTCQEWLDIDNAEFKRSFAMSAMLRTGLKKIQDNVKNI